MMKRLNPFSENSEMSNIWRKDPVWSSFGLQSLLGFPMNIDPLIFNNFHSKTKIMALILLNFFNPDIVNLKVFLNLKTKNLFFCNSRFVKSAKKWLISSPERYLPSILKKSLTNWSLIPCPWIYRKPAKEFILCTTFTSERLRFWKGHDLIFPNWWNSMEKVIINFAKKSNKWWVFFTCNVICCLYFRRKGHHNDDWPYHWRGCRKARGLWTSSSRSRVNLV